MSFDHLQLFKEIVHQKSISKGAVACGITQSAASQHLMEMERRLDAVLLDRLTRPFTLTDAGRLYHDFCRDVLRRKDEFDTALEGLKDAVEGVVRVASIYSVGLSEISHLEKEYARRFPAARLHVEYLRPEKVYERVLNDQADLGLVSYAHATKEIGAIPWREEEMVVAAPPSNPLAHKQTIRSEEIAGEDFVAFDEDLPIRREVDHFLREHGIEVNIIMHFDNLQMIKEAVAVGSGISIVPARVMQTEILQGRLASIRLTPPALVRPLGILYRRRKKLNRATQCFLDLLQEKPADSAEAPTPVMAR